MYAKQSPIPKEPVATTTTTTTTTATTTTEDSKLQKLLERVSALERSQQQLRNQLRQGQRDHDTPNAKQVFGGIIVTVFIIMVLAVCSEYFEDARNAAWLREFGVDGYRALNLRRSR
jgi:hypothetical protein